RQGGRGPNPVRVPPGAPAAGETRRGGDPGRAVPAAPEAVPGGQGGGRGSSARRRPACGEGHSRCGTGGVDVGRARRAELARDDYEELKPMSTVPPQPTTRKKRRLPTDRVVIRGVSWESYLRVGRAFADRRLRITYDRGTLEIMTVSP